jgi:hypothetical protein
MKYNYKFLITNLLRRNKNNYHFYKKAQNEKVNNKNPPYHTYLKKLRFFPFQQRFHARRMKRDKL